ncbi:MAG: metal ABC transporter permease [Eubacteriales bacterium]
MTGLYNVMDMLLPFDWSTHIFMKNALLGVLLVTPIFGLLGTMVVNNRMAFFSDAIGHSALTGIAIGVLLGFGQPLWSMVVFSVLLAFAIMAVKKANTASTDTIIGVFSSTAIALGIVLLSRSGGFTKYSSFLIGDLLSINSTDLAMLAVTFVVVIVLWFVIFNKLLVVSVNSSLAHSRGIHVNLYETVFTIITAIVVTISIQWVGVLIISSLLVLPAAAARNIANGIRQYHFFSIIIAVFSGVAGLIASYYWDSASGATIVLVTAVIFSITFICKRIRR